MAIINVTKASEDHEPFNEAKLRRILVATGADSKVIEQIISAIDDNASDYFCMTYH